MKYLLFSCIFWFVLFNCNAQNSVFNSYLTNFGQSILPISIFDRQSSYTIFCQHHDSILGLMPKIIPKYSVEKFICKDGFCNSDERYFRYDYGVKLDFSKDFISVLVSKFQFEGKKEWDFDLTEIILLTYNNEGKIISRQVLCQDNDRWKSKVKIWKDSISIQQIKIIEPKMNKTKELSCEIYTITYKILKEGLIKITYKSPITFGKVIWNKSIEDYKLTE